MSTKPGLPGKLTEGLQILSCMETVPGQHIIIPAYVAVLSQQQSRYKHFIFSKALSFAFKICFIYHPEVHIAQLITKISKTPLLYTIAGYRIAGSKQHHCKWFRVQLHTILVSFLFHDSLTQRQVPIVLHTMTLEMITSKVFSGKVTNLLSTQGLHYKTMNSPIASHIKLSISSYSTS